MKKRIVSHSMQGAFVFVLLGLFAIMSTLLVLLGAQMYRNVTMRADQGNENRILNAYVRSMVRAEDAQEALSIEEHDGITTLAMHEMIGEDPYVTWIYTYDGMLCEQFTRAEREFKPEAGSKLAEANSFEPEIRDGMVTVTIGYGDEQQCVITESLRCSSGTDSGEKQEKKDA
jgi:hypothetical protein